MHIDSSTWNYTLSTLAQVLAAILGLTSIFIALKLEHIVQKIDYHKRRGASILKGISEEHANELAYFRASYILAQLKTIEEICDGRHDIIEHLQRVLKRYDGAAEISEERARRFLSDTIYALENNIRQKEHVLLRLIMPSLITVSGMVASLVTLGAANILIGSRYDVVLFWSVLLISIIGIIMILIASYNIFRSIE